ncbi:MAG: hypothetical protein OEL89_03260, partial [Candidatus Peregrinibacteria bacterium]|nr:hypothetical protein [Candidatus Peregrinibacteria bacterium]
MKNKKLVSVLKNVKKLDLSKVIFLVFLLVGLSFTYFTCVVLSRNLVEREQEQFMQEVTLIERSIMAVVEKDKLIVAGGKGLFDASEFVTKKEWREYVKSLDLRNKLPQIRGLGFTEYVKD